MLAHISSVKNNHKTPPTIPGWDAKMDYACEESLYWHNTWIQCDRPDRGIIYNIMKKCRSVYHYVTFVKKTRDEHNILCSVLKELCAIRDNITTCDIANITDIIAMIEDICTTCR